MDFTVNMNVWNKLAPELQGFVQDEIQIYSNIHFGEIQ
jgi:hypothetical protein